jgi:hypothetical protein
MEYFLMRDSGSGAGGHIFAGIQVAVVTGEVA